MRGLGLQLGGPGERVELRVGVAASERLRHEDVDGDAVLGVHHDHGARLGRVLHGPQDLAVVGVQHPGVGHEQLEAGDALVVDQVGHRLQRLVVDTADDLVEAVVDRAVARRLLVPHGELIVDAEAGVLHGEVDDRGDATPRRGASCRSRTCRTPRSHRTAAPCGCARRRRRARRTCRSRRSSGRGSRPSPPPVRGRESPRPSHRRRARRPRDGRRRRSPFRPRSASWPCQPSTSSAYASGRRSR